MRSVTTPGSAGGSSTPAWASAVAACRRTSGRSSRALARSVPHSPWRSGRGRFANSAPSGAGRRDRPEMLGGDVAGKRVAVLGAVQAQLGRRARLPGVDGCGPAAAPGCGGAVHDPEGHGQCSAGLSYLDVCWTRPSPHAVTPTSSCTSRNGWSSARSIRSNSAPWSGEECRTAGTSSTGMMACCRLDLPGARPALAGRFDHVAGNLRAGLQGSPQLTRQLLVPVDRVSHPAERDRQGVAAPDVTCRMPRANRARSIGPVCSSIVSASPPAKDVRARARVEQGAGR